MSHLFCFGFGYSARAFARRCLANGWQVSGTARSKEGVVAMEAAGVRGLVFDGEQRSDEVARGLGSASHVLVSAGPDDRGDPVLRCHRDDLAQSDGLKWIGYLSTVGVYGNHDGAWVDEDTTPNPTSERSKRRLASEMAWRELADNADLALQIFRLAGIYGPGRSAIDKLRAGTARRLIKPGQVFNRIHVEDIALVLQMACAAPDRDGIYNVSDDLPAPPQDVVSFAAEVLGVPEPEALEFDSANISSMARSFYSENKRIRNGKMKETFGISLKFPSYREGIAAIAANS